MFLVLAPLSKYNKKPLPKGKVIPCENLIQADKDLSPVSASWNRYEELSGLFCSCAQRRGSDRKEAKKCKKQGRNASREESHKWDLKGGIFEPSIHQKPQFLEIKLMRGLANRQLCITFVILVTAPRKYTIFYSFLFS